MSQTPFNEKGFGARYMAMGDIAEGAFERVNPTAHRLGLNRPAFSVSTLKPILRNTPDYLLPSGFYEVMGISSRGDGTLKLKIEKIESLYCWSLLSPTYLWVWDSGKKRWWCDSIQDWNTACHQHAEMCKFPDNDKPYWKLHFNNFPSGPNSEV